MQFVHELQLTTCGCVINAFLKSLGLFDGSKKLADSNLHATVVHVLVMTFCTTMENVAAGSHKIFRCFDYPHASSTFFSQLICL